MKAHSTVQQTGYIKKRQLFLHSEKIPVTRMESGNEAANLLRAKYSIRLEAPNEQKKK